MSGRNGNEDRSMEQIQREIADTRDHLGHTLDLLQHKLSPSEMRERAMANMRRRMRTMNYQARDTVSSNPMLFGLLGSAIALALFARDEDRRQRYIVEPAGRARSWLTESGDRIQTSMPARDIRHRYGRPNYRARMQTYVPRDYRASAERVRGGMQRSMEQMRHRAAEMGIGMREQATHARERWHAQAPHWSDSGMSAIVGMIAGYALEAAHAAYLSRKPMTGRRRQRWYSPEPTRPVSDEQMRQAQGQATGGGQTPASRTSASGNPPEPGGRAPGR